MQACMLTPPPSNPETFFFPYQGKLSRVSFATKAVHIPYDTDWMTTPTPEHLATGEYLCLYGESRTGKNDKPLEEVEKHLAEHGKCCLILTHFRQKKRDAILVIYKKGDIATSAIAAWLSSSLSNADLTIDAAVHCRVQE